MENITITDHAHLLREFMQDITYNIRGRYNYYVVYCGREPGIFNSWYDVYVLWPENGNN